MNQHTNLVSIPKWLEKELLASLDVSSTVFYLSKESPRDPIFNRVQAMREEPPADVIFEGEGEKEATTREDRENPGDIDAELLVGQGHEGNSELNRRTLFLQYFKNRYTNFDKLYIALVRSNQEELADLLRPLVSKPVLTTERGDPEEEKNRLGGSLCDRLQEHSVFPIEESPKGDKGFYLVKCLGGKGPVVEVEARGETSTLSEIKTSITTACPTKKSIFVIAVNRLGKHIRLTDDAVVYIRCDLPLHKVDVDIPVVDNHDESPNVFILSVGVELFYF